VPPREHRGCQAPHEKDARLTLSNSLIEETEFFLEETKLLIALPMAISFVITVVVFVVDKTVIYLCKMFIKLIVQILSFCLSECGCL